MKTKLVLNTDPYKVVRASNRDIVGLYDTKEEAEEACLRFNRSGVPKLPDGSYAYDRVEYVVAHRPEYKYVEE